MSSFDLGCVGIQEGQPQYGVTFTLEPGTIFGAVYGTFLWARFEPGTNSVTVAFTHHLVTIRGRELESLVADFTQAIVRSVRVASRAELLAASSAAPVEPLVESISIKSLEREDGSTAPPAPDPPSGTGGKSPWKKRT